MTALDPTAVVRAWNDAVRRGDRAKLAAMSTDDFRVYLNHRRGETDAAGAGAALDRLTGACAQIEYSDTRLVETGQGVLSEELVAGTTRDGNPFRFRRLRHFHTNAQGKVYRIEHFVDSAALAPLEAAVAADKPAPP